MFNLLDFNLDEVQPYFLTVKEAAQWCIENCHPNQVYFVSNEKGDIVAIIHCETVWTPNSRLTPWTKKKKVNP